MGKNIDYAIWVLIVILAVLVLGYLSSAGVFEKIRLKTAGRATEQEAETYADIQKYFAINRSVNFTDGIRFTILSTGTPNNNATGNFDASDETLYYLTVEQDSNVNVDICIRANDTLRSGPDAIAINNYIWSNSTTNDGSNPSLGNAKALQVLGGTNYDESAFDIGIGASSYYRFWLSIPVAQESGVYRNKVEFTSVETGTGGCTS